MLFHPRFSIHSWHSGSVNEPWMFPESTHLIRALLRLRMALIPYFSHLFRASARSCDPVLMPVFVQFETEDFECRDDYLLGPDLLAAPVLEQGQKWRQVLLPKGTSWFFFPTMELCTSITQVEAPLGTAVFFVRAGSVIPFDPQYWAGRDFQCPSLMVFPPVKDENVSFDSYTIIFERNLISVNSKNVLIALPETEKRPVAKGIDHGVFQKLRFVLIQN